MPDVATLRIKLFADTASLPSIRALADNPLIQGFTTNATLMRKAGVTDAAAFARELLTAIPDRPVSFGVFADDWEMEPQALEIASWAANVFVKIPVTTVAGESCAPLIGRLSRQGVQVNVTAVFTEAQVEEIAMALSPTTPAFVSVFAGRIADTGRDPVPVIGRALEILRPLPRVEVLWASSRELFNVFQADAVGCHAITAACDLLDKLRLVGRDLTHLSRETVEMFHRDAVASGFSLSDRAALSGGRVEGV